MEGRYFTIKEMSTGLFKDRGSKFISHALPANNEQSAKDHVSNYRKKYHDARHVCFAYRSGTNPVIERANDDGEPGNSAGKPILNQIQVRNLTNTLVIVVRYFGGTLLGVSGLVNAYKNAASDALEKATILKKTEKCPVAILFSYPDLNTVMRVISTENLELTNEKYSDTNCRLEVLVEKTRVEEVESMFAPVSNLNIKLLTNNYS